MSKHYITWEQKRSRVLKHYQPVLWRIGLSLSRTKECPQLLLPMIQNWNKPDETGENNSISAAKWTSILLQGIGESTWYSVLETKTPTIRRQTLPPPPTSYNNWRERVLESGKEVCSAQVNSGRNKVKDPNFVWHLVSCTNTTTFRSCHYCLNCIFLLLSWYNRFYGKMKLFMHSKTNVKHNSDKG